MNATHEQFTSTQTPWVINSSEDVCSANGFRLAIPKCRETAEIIITAVNSHAALLAACQSALPIIKAFDMGRYPPANTRDVIQQLEAALQLAKGE